MMSLGQSLERYSETISALEAAQARPSAEQVLAVLKARDVVQAALIDRTQDSVDDLVTLIELDRRLKQQTVRIAQNVKLADWRASLQPSEKAWWWFTELPPDRWSRFDWLWTALTVLCLTISFALVADISSRFLTAGPDTWAALAVVGQSVLTLLAAGGALTVAGQEAIKRILVSLRVPAYFWQEAKFTLAVFVLAGLLVLRFSLPGIAVWYNNQGLQNYHAGYLTSAQLDYLRAIKLNPDYLQAHYNLGVLYEDLQQIDKARSEYLTAVQGGLDAAHNNLARLNILAENYAAAVPLLKKGLILTREDEVRYDLHKNLGWARFGQARYEEAIVELEAAIALSPNMAPAHCLLAQVLERRGEAAGALAEWETCLKLADPLRPDEDTWIGLARQRVTGVGE
jgi:tetratricopeptide (TPR) repeat protein